MTDGSNTGSRVSAAPRVSDCRAAYLGKPAVGIPFVIRSAFW